MLSEKLGHKLDAPLAAIIKKSFLVRLSPTTLTIAGLIVNLVAAVGIIYSYWKSAGILILIAGFFDMLDGAAARTLKKVSPFGGFIDSVVDRYSDMAIIIAFIIYYALQNNIYMVSLCAIASIGIVLIPYTRARAESFIGNCNVGIMERAERILLIAAGCLFNIINPVLWILTVFTHITVLQRVHYTWKQSNKIQTTGS